MNDATEALSYRIYVTDTLWLMGEEKRPKFRWIDTIDNSEPEEDQRSCSEITHDIFARIRGEKK